MIAVETGVCALIRVLMRPKGGIMKEKARKAQGIKPPADLTSLVADAYLKQANVTNQDVMLSFSSWMGKMMNEIANQYAGATNIVEFNNKWGGQCFRHDAITICALRAKATPSAKEEQG